MKKIGKQAEAGTLGYAVRAVVGNVNLAENSAPQQGVGGLGRFSYV